MSSSIFLQMVTVLAANGFPWNDPCTLYPNPVRDEVIDLKANVSCKAGTIDWNYPRGSLRVEFGTQLHKGYVVCVSSEFSSPSSIPMEIVKGYNDQHFAEGNEICIHSSDGDLTILFHARRAQFYVVWYKYRIIQLQF